MCPWINWYHGQFKEWKDDETLSKTSLNKTPSKRGKEGAKRENLGSPSQKSKTQSGHYGAKEQIMFQSPNGKNIHTSIITSEMLVGIAVPKQNMSKSSWIIECVLTPNWNPKISKNMPWSAAFMNPAGSLNCFRSPAQSLILWRFSKTWNIRFYYFWRFSKTQIARFH